MIEIWYGENQRFGHLGMPQRWVNILGRITGEQGIISSRYSLNGEGFVSLPLGPDKRRLLKPGDFNIDMGIEILKDGANEIVVEADDLSGTRWRRKVDFIYYPERSWPLPAYIDWNSSTDIQQHAQIVDGRWKLVEDGIRIEEPGYDRLIALGDMFWKDFEITVPITIHSFDESIIGIPPSNHSAVGLILRFLGHANWDGTRPRWGYAPVGAIAWYSYIPDLMSYRRTFMTGSDLDVAFFGTDSSSRQLPLGVRHIFKARVESRDNNTSTYSLKVWKDGETEPPDWDISAPGFVGELSHGSVLLIAHNSDATFGNVCVTPL